VRTRPIIISLVAFSFFAAAILVFTGHSSAEVFSRKLATAVRSDSAGIRLSGLTPRSWEHVHVFGPYTTPAQISTALGFAYSDKPVETIRSSDSVNLLLFVSGQRVVLSVLHPRNQGDFYPHATGHSFTPEDGIFSVERRQQDSWVLLRPVSSQPKSPNHALEPTRTGAPGWPRVFRFTCVFGPRGSAWDR
jgi:hypothetical protein